MRDDGSNLVETKLATITVTFNPEIQVLSAQLMALPRGCRKIIIDNASACEVQAQIRMLVQNIPNAKLVCNEANLGLGAAINRGVRLLHETAPSVPFVLLLDQDSEPQVGSLPILLEAFERLSEKGARVGCVGPTLLDPDTGLQHGFHQSTTWRWRRVRPSRDSTEPVPCANLNGSGTLVAVTLFLMLGGLDESLFIDHLDTDWAFRVTSGGYELWGIPNAVFIHRMGRATARLWCLGWHVWPLRSPQRHYFLYRNAVALMWRDYVPRVWKIWAVVKLMLTTVITVVSGPQRAMQFGSMVRGVRDGLAMKEKDMR